MNNSTAASADQARHLHPFSYQKAMREEGFESYMTRAKGVHLYDRDGRAYIDAVAGLACVNIGYSRDDMAEAIAEATRTMSFHSVFYNAGNDYSSRLVEKLHQVTPDSVGYYSFANSGSEANDTANKMVRWYWNLMGKPGKKHIIAREMGYHGANVLSASLTGLEPFHPQFDLPIEGARVSHIMTPWAWAHGTHCDDESFGLRAAQAVEDEILRLGADKVAAFIGEPVPMAGGVLTPPMNYWKEVERICRKHDVLLIMDEVVTGFGRTGEWFGQTYYGITPDITVMGKGISSVYFPVSAVGLHPRIGEVIAHDPGALYHGYTTNCHPVGAAAAVKNIEIIEQEGIVEHVREVISPTLKERLAALADHPLVGEVRCVGAMAALQLTADKETREFFPEEQHVDGMVARHAFDQGVNVRDVGADIVAMSPVLTTTADQVHQVMDAVEVALERTRKNLNR